MPIKPQSFRVRDDGRFARLRLTDLPVPDTFAYANNVSVAATIDVDLIWEATSEPITRGKGTSVPSNSAEAFLGEMRDATCRGKARARETGFNMKSGPLTQEGYVASMGYSRNGVFLP